MASQLLAKFESTPSYTARKTQVKIHNSVFNILPRVLFYIIVVGLRFSLSSCNILYVCTVSIDLQTNTLYICLYIVKMAICLLHEYVLNFLCRELELWLWSAVLIGQNFPFANATNKVFSCLLFPAFTPFSLFYFCDFLLTVFQTSLQNLSQTARGPLCCKLLTWLRVFTLNSGLRSHLNLLLRRR